MRNRRRGDNDRHFWPFTLSYSKSYRPFGVMLDSGAHEDRSGDCHIRLNAFGWTLICELPPVVRDYRVRHSATSWDAATVARLGRDWYEEAFPCEYGFSYYFDGTLHVHWGPQTHSSSTTKSKCFFLPWQNWRFIRHSLYDVKGQHFCTELERCRMDWAASSAVKDACPKKKFEFEDFDGKRIVATTHIEEREWRFGTGAFSWLSWFVPKKVRRSLAIEFSEEVGPEKGSWKGGTLGHGIDMLPDELHEAAFKRYCKEEHRSKYRRFHIKYLGPVIETPPPIDPQAQAVVG